MKNRSDDFSEQMAKMDADEKQIMAILQRPWTGRAIDRLLDDTAAQSKDQLRLSVYHQTLRAEKAEALLAKEERRRSWAWVVAAFTVLLAFWFMVGSFVWGWIQ